MAFTYSDMTMEAVKLVVVCDLRAGKTCLLCSFVHKFPDKYVQTVFGALVDRDSGGSVLCTCLPCNHTQIIFIKTQTITRQMFRLTLLVQFP